MPEQAVDNVIAVIAPLVFVLILAHGFCIFRTLNGRFNRALQRWYPHTHIELWFAKLDAPELIDGDRRVRRLYRAYASVLWILALNVLVRAALWITVGKWLLAMLLKKLASAGLPI